MFKRDGEKLGRTDVIRYQIDTKNPNLIKTAPRRIPIYWQTEVKDIIKDKLRNNVIHPFDHHGQH